jgi:hypothetical protein
VDRQVAIFQSLQQLQVVLKREVARMLAAGIDSGRLDALQEEVDRVDYATSEAAREAVTSVMRHDDRCNSAPRLPLRCNSPVEGLIDQLGNCLLGADGDDQDEAVEVVA